MTETIILMVDYDKICRLCLQSTSGMTDIFEKNEENSLQHLVHRATDLKVESKHGLPSKICYRCRYLVELSCEFRDMVDKTQALLLNAVHNIASRESEQMSLREPEITEDRDNRTLPEQQPITPTDINLNLNWNELSENRKNESFEELGVDRHLTSSKRKVIPKHLTCQICLSVFANTEEVQLHVASHYKDSILTPYIKVQRPYHCEQCNNEEMSKSQLISHHRAHLNINPFVCKEPDCKFVGKNQDSLRHHNLKHRALSIVCEVCGAAFRRSFELLQHNIRTHGAAAAAAAAAAQCPTCHCNFRNILSLRQHARICKKPHRYACEWTGCTKAYHSRAELATHRRTHSDDRAFRCHLCDVAAYTSKSMLTRHVRMHSRVPRRGCDRCAAAPADYGALYAHRVATHGPWQPYRCNHCNRGYQTEANLEKHLKTCETAAVREQTGRAAAAAAAARAHTQLHGASIEEITDTCDKAVELEGEISEDVPDRMQGHSLLAHTVNIRDVSRDFVLKELPSDGLLYITTGAENEQDQCNTNWEQ